LKWFAIFLAGLFLSTSGCGGTRPSSYEAKEKAGIQVLSLQWVKRLYPSLPNFLVPSLAEENDRFNPVETSSAGFDLELERVFIGTSQGDLYCLDWFRGDTIWRFTIKDPVGSKPLHDPTRKTVFFGADDGKYYALHSRSGRLLWATDTGAEIRRSTLAYKGTLYIINAANTVLALDPDSGEVLWQYRRPLLEGFSSAGHAGLARYGDYLITGFSDGYVVAINALTGSVAWEHDLAAEIMTVSPDGELRLVDADATPVVSGDILVAASVTGGLQGLEADSGTVLWTRPDISGVTGLAESNGLIYTARTNFGLTALNPNDGSIVWSEKFRTGVLQDPLPYNDVLLVSDSIFGFYVVSATTGKLMQRVDQREGFFARPSVGGGYMLIMGNFGTLYAMSIL
jgi:outer membrane protein assembly factor BamB